MPIVHRNKNNSDIKQCLKERKITYLDLANASGYSKGTIDQWMRHPLTDTQREIIQSSIDKIMKSCSANESNAASSNYQLRKQMIEENVSYSDLGKRLGKSQSYIWNRLNNTNLSNEETAMIFNVIESIAEERRLLHED